MLNDLWSVCTHSQCLQHCRIRTSGMWSGLFLRPEWYYLHGMQLCLMSCWVPALVAFQRFIEDYCPPPYQSVEKHLKVVLDKHISFITQCRSHSIPMGGAIRWLKATLTGVNSTSLTVLYTPTVLCNPLCLQRDTASIFVDLQYVSAENIYINVLLAFCIRSPCQLCVAG